MADKKNEAERGLNSSAQSACPGKLFGRNFDVIRDAVPTSTSFDHQKQIGVFTEFALIFASALPIPGVETAVINIGSLSAGVWLNSMKNSVPGISLTMRMLMMPATAIVGESSSR
jgi:hypothetical protein